MIKKIKHYLRFMPTISEIVTLFIFTIIMFFVLVFVTYIVSYVYENIKK
jgi:hypothetical protein